MFETQSATADPASARRPWHVRNPSVIERPATRAATGKRIRASDGGTDARVLTNYDPEEHHGDPSRHE